MERELTALSSLKRNVKFWFDSCGYSNEQVIKQIENWYDFAYAPAEQEQAKIEVLSELYKPSGDKVFDYLIVLISAGFEYPDAEYKTAIKFKMEPVAVARLYDNYCQ